MQYVSDIIGEEYLKWETGKRVLIATPTGSGKTTFVLQTLLRHAVQLKKHVVYYCNRRVLNDQFSAISEEKIQKMYKNSEDITAEEAMAYLHIYTYQKMETIRTHPDLKEPVNPNDSEDDSEEFEESHWLRQKEILYYIFDEAHYFVDDATLNSDTNYWICNDRLNLPHSVSVYLTATPDSLFTILSDSKDLLEKNSKELRTQFTTPNRIEDHATAALKNFTNECKDMKIKLEFPKKEDLMIIIRQQLPSPFEWLYDRLNQAINQRKGIDYLYPKQPDYTHVEPFYFKEYEDLVEDIRRRSQEKWLIFVDDENIGQEFTQQLTEENIGSVGFLSRQKIDHNKAAQKIYKSIVDNQCFEERILVTTSVLDCGINIHDPAVKNIVIACSSKTKFLQMLGRKRLDDGEHIRLYIKAYDFQLIHRRYHQDREYLKILNLFSLKNEYTYIKRSGKKPSFNDDKLEDGYIYGSYLKRTELENLSHHIRSAPDWLWYVKDPDYKKYRKVRGHLAWVDETEKINERFFSEFKFSGTASLNLLMQMQEFEESFHHYYVFDTTLFPLCEFMRFCIPYLRRLPQESWQHLFDLGISSVFKNVPLAYRQDIPHKKECLLQDYSQKHIESLRGLIKRSPSFYLEQQLSWLGKKYNEECWLDRQSKLTALSDYLKDCTDSKRIVIPREFTWECVKMIRKLPILPEPVKKDITRYRYPKPLPQQAKLHACFLELKLPYEIQAKKKMVKGKSQIYWTVVSTQSKENPSE